MKFKSLFFATAGLLAMASCTEEKFDLGTIDVSPEDLIEGVAYTVTHDSSNPNIVYLKSLLPANYNIAWETPQGRVVAPEATLKIPFDGEYEFRMAVATRGGYVWSDPGKFTIDDFCADFVSHYLWTNLTGGVGNSKIWQLDLGIDENGNTKVTKWGAPHGFYNANYTWDKLHASTETETSLNNYMDAEVWDASSAIDPSETGDDELGDESNWSWLPSYSGATWMCNAQNWGYMELSLDNGANCTVYDAEMNVVGKGTFLLDTDNHTISFSDVYPLWTSNSNPSESGAKSFKVLYLSNEGMILIAPGTNTAANFVTKDLFDNYVAEEVEQAPELPEGWEDLVGQVTVTTTTIKWTLSEENPTDWCNLDGTRMNGWNSLADYADWYGTPNPDAYKDFSMTLDSDNNSAVFEYPDGTKVETTYTLDDKGIFTFADMIPSGLSGALGSWDSFYVDANNSLRIMSIETKRNSVTGLWLGAINDDATEYHAYHFIPNLGNDSQGGSTTPSFSAKYWDFDSSLVKYINGDEGHGRLAFCDEWGNDAIDHTKMGWNENIYVTFQVTGAPDSFSGRAALGVAANSWGISLWRAQNYTTTVKGDGIYTVYYDGDTVEPGNLIALCPEIEGLNVDDYPDVEVTLIGVATDVSNSTTQWAWNPSLVSYIDGDEGHGRIAFCDEWGNDAIDHTKMGWTNGIAVTFKVEGAPAGYSGKAALGVAGNSWGVSVWRSQNYTATLNGDGVYTVTYDSETVEPGNLIALCPELSDLAPSSNPDVKVTLVDVRTW